MLVFFLAQNASALEANITSKTIGVFLKGEYNRGFLHQGSVSAIGSLALNEQYTLRGGLSLGGSVRDTDIQAFASAGVAPFTIPLNFTLGYTYNGFPEYNAHAHAIVPMVSYNSKWIGASLGPSFRFTSFLGEDAHFESVLSGSVHFNFLTTEIVQLILRFSNVNDFTIRNFGAYSLTLNSIVRLNEQWVLINDLELMQSGSVGLSANFYGIAWRGGVQFTW